MTDRWLAGLLTAIGMFLSAILGLTLYLLKITADTRTTTEAMQVSVSTLKEKVTEIHDNQATFVARMEWEKAEQRHEATHEALTESIRLLNESMKKR